MTKKEKVEEVIAVQLFKNLITQIELNLKSEKFRLEVKAHAEALNKALSKDFAQITCLLQNVVDKFYWSKYEINGYFPFNSIEFDSALKHNLEIINSCKKLCKFID